MSEIEHPMKTILEQKGQVLDMMAIGVSSKYRGKKIGSKLMELAMKNGKEKGFKYVYAFVNDVRSQHLFAKEGCVTIAKLINPR